MKRTAPKRVCICDRASDPAAAGEIVEAVNREWRRGGVGGVHLIGVAFSDGVLTIDTGPGQEPLTVERVKKAIQPQEQAA